MICKEYDFTVSNDLNLELELIEHHDESHYDNAPTILLCHSITWGCR